MEFIPSDSELFYIMTHEFIMKVSHLGRHTLIAVYFKSFRITIFFFLFK